MVQEIFIGIVVSVIITILSLLFRLIYTIFKQQHKKFQIKPWDSVLTDEAKQIWEDHERLWLSVKGTETGIQKFLEPEMKGQVLGIPIICSLFTLGEKNILLLPSFDSVGEDAKDVEGIGRTEILLELLGVHLPYARIMGLEDTEVIQTVGEVIRYFEQRSFQCKMIVSDMGILTVKNYHLRLVPFRGEKIIFAWDIARHLFRLSHLEYQKGMHRRGEYRDLLCKIFANIPISSISPVYAELTQMGGYHPIDRVVVIKRVIDRYQRPTVRILNEDEKLDLFKRSLCVARKHGSDFWQKLNFELFEKNVNAICSYTKKTILALPIYEITYYWPSLTIPLFIYQNIASLINNPQRTEIEHLRKEYILNGISEHNAVVLNHLCNASEVIFVARSHEKLLRDPAFWKNLMVTSKDKKVRVTFILLDPEVAEKNHKLRIAYQDKWEGFLAAEIRSNLSAIKRLALKISNLKLSIFLTRSDPVFRITLINNTILLLAGYKPVARTDENTSFLKFTAGENENILYAFKRYIMDTLQQCSRIN